MGTTVHLSYGPLNDTCCMSAIFSLALPDAAFLYIHFDAHLEAHLEIQLEARLETYPEFRLACTDAYIDCDCVEKIEVPRGVLKTNFRSILPLLGWKTGSQI